jgi:hypothetical protein
MREFFVGLDLGQVHEYTALAVVDRFTRSSLWGQVIPCSHLLKEVILELRDPLFTRQKEVLLETLAFRY